ncbi:MAG TPA: TIM barrel protein [Chloroflexota bacterium]|nr:TIM barrel protein [Chloroflexota bacterium]
MRTGSPPLARILLKARPTESQLADRLAPPMPDGLELYLDRADIADAPTCDAVVDRIRERQLPADFAIVVEGPIRSLDNSYVDVSACTDATRELIRRLGEMAARLAAPGVVMHCIMPRFSLTDEDWDQRDAALEAALEFARFYAETLLPMGVTPVIENVPPVLRMREGRYLFTPLGMSPQDIQWLIERVPGLMATLDISHAQLYVNARGMADRDESDSGVQPLMRYLRKFPTIDSVEDFIDVLGPSIFEAHVSNASGLLGEGAPYDEGDIDMSRVIGRLARCARFLVTETLEADNDRAIYMRAAQRGMASVLSQLMNHP